MNKVKMWIGITGLVGWFLVVIYWGIKLFLGA
jgi:hypothetical protein